MGCQLGDFMTTGKKGSIQTPDESPIAGLNTIDTEMTKTILQRKLSAIMSPDLEDHLADYADDAIVVTPEIVVQGVSSIRVYFTGLLNWTRTANAQFHLKSEFVQGEFAYITWSLKTSKIWVPEGTDTFVIRGGKILFHAMTGSYKILDSQSE